MEQELAYSFHLGSDKNKSKVAKKTAKGNVSGTTSLSNNAIQNANDLLHELTTNKDIEKAICAMTIGRAIGGSSLAKYKYKK